MTIRTSLPALLLAAAIASAAGAAMAQSAQTAVAYDAGSNDNRPAPQAGACAINIVRVADARPVREGLSIDTPVPAGALDAWLGTSLDALKGYGYTVQHGGAAQPGMLNLDVRLIRAYTWMGHMRINGVVALDVNVDAPAGAHPYKFRASGSKNNLMGSASEHVTALNYAVNNVVDKMARGLAAECGQVRQAQR